MNYSVQIDMPELDSEILEQIETVGEAASPDNSFIYLMAFLCVCFFIVSYLLYFKPEWVYKITQSWCSRSKFLSKNLIIFVKNPFSYFSILLNKYPIPHYSDMGYFGILYSSTIKSALSSAIKSGFTLSFMSGSKSL